MYTLDIITPFFGNILELYKYLNSINKIKIINIKVRVIIVNDNRHLINEKIKKYSQFDLLILNNKKNLGPAASRNKGLKKSKAQFVWFLDHDVQIENINIITEMIKYLSVGKRKNFFAISGSYEKLNYKRINLLPVIFKNNICLYKILKINTFEKTSDIYDGTSLFIFRRTFNKVGLFDVSLRAYEDYEWATRGKLKFIFKNNFSVFHNKKEPLRTKPNINYIYNIVNCRKKILKKNKKFKRFILPFLDLIYLSQIFLCLYLFKTHRSARFHKYSSHFTKLQIIQIIKMIIKNYF